ncbi:DNMT1 methyltransferase, partial [Probosciger aterrimus]|nr:DNMT1 methyltransferase [Probosciger aterrimus]
APAFGASGAWAPPPPAPRRPLRPFPQESLREKLSLIHGFLQADVQKELSELEAQLRCEELSEVGFWRPSGCGGFRGAGSGFIRGSSRQERYLAKVKALLRQELSAQNGAAAANGCSGHGAYGSDEDSERAGADGEDESAMELEEGAASSSSSCAPRLRKARRSRSNGESKSNGALWFPS